MMGMYNILFGDIEERRIIMDWLERQLFSAPPIESEVCHLHYDMWKSLKDTVTKGEYIAESQ